MDPHMGGSNGLLLDPRFSDHKIRRCFFRSMAPFWLPFGYWSHVTLNFGRIKKFRRKDRVEALCQDPQWELIPHLTQFQTIFGDEVHEIPGIPRPALHDPRIAGFATYTIGASFLSTSRWKVSNGRSKNESTCCLNFNWIYLEQTWKTTMLLNWKCGYKTSNDKLQLKSVSLANFLMANPIDQPCSMTHVRWDSIGFCWIFLGLEKHWARRKNYTARISLQINIYIYI